MTLKALAISCLLTAGAIAGFVAMAEQNMAAPVVLECLEDVTDTDVVRQGRQATELIAMGRTVVLCGYELSREEAAEMAAY